MAFKDAKTHFGEASYWSQVVLAWTKVNYRPPSNKSEVMNQILWLNSGIQLGSKMLNWKTWIEAGILFISDVVREDGQLITWDELGRSFNTRSVNWLEYNTLCSCIPPEWCDMIRSPTYGELRPLLFDAFSKEAKVARKAYNMLISDSSVILKYAQSWISTHIPSLETEEYMKSFRHLHYHVSDQKLKDFQY